jgi:hypothetical protein
MWVKNEISPSKKHVKLFCQQCVITECIMGHLLNSTTIKLLRWDVLNSCKLISFDDPQYRMTHNSDLPKCAPGYNIYTYQPRLPLHFGKWAFPVQVQVLQFSREVCMCEVSTVLASTSLASPGLHYSCASYVVYVQSLHNDKGLQSSSHDPRGRLRPRGCSRGG